MKVIDIPEEVEVKYRVKTSEGSIEQRKEKVKFTKFLSDCCDMYQAFAKGPKMARQYGKIMDKIESVNGDKSVSFEDSDFEVVKGAVENASWITPDINRAYVPFYDAVDKAQDVQE